MKRRWLSVGLAVLELIVVAALLLVAMSGCQARMSKADKAAAAHERQAARRHILQPIRPVADDLDRQLARVSGFGVAATAVSAAGFVFVAFEASAWLRLALAIMAACAGSTLLVFALRLAVPVLAIAVPWLLAAALIAGLVAAYLWYKHETPVKLRVPWRRKPAPAGL